MVTHFSLDTEATGATPQLAKDQYHPATKVTYMSWWREQDDRGIGDTLHIDQPRVQAVRQWMQDPAKVPVFWNAKYDLHLLRKAGIRRKGRYEDAMVLARLVRSAEKQYTLKHFSRKYLKVLYREETRLQKYCNKHKCAYGDAPRRLVEPYNLLDAKCTYELWWVLSRAATPAIWKLYHREMRVLQMVIQMERRGVFTDQGKCQAFIEEVDPKLRRIKERLQERTGRADFNPMSNPQVVDVLFNGEVQPTRFSKKTGEPSTDYLALMDHPDPIARGVLKYRELHRFRRMYLRAYTERCDKRGVVHATFNQAGTRTGRFSSGGPNLQNVPRPDDDTWLGRTRSIIVARPGYVLLFSDYDQIELKLGAVLSKEPRMLRAILAGDDLHAVTAKRVLHARVGHPRWGMYRTTGKTLNFAVFYGVQADTFRETLLKMSGLKIRLSRSKAVRYLAHYRAYYKRIPLFFEEVEQEVAETGGVVNPFGRYMEVPRDKPYVGVNYKVQSAAADIIKMAMVNVRKYIKDSGLQHDVHPLMQVHDELVFEIREELLQTGVPQELKGVMEQPDLVEVPLTCSLAYGYDWGHKTKMEE